MKPVIPSQPRNGTRRMSARQAAGLLPPGSERGTMKEWRVAIPLVLFGLVVAAWSLGSYTWAWVGIVLFFVMLGFMAFLDVPGAEADNAEHEMADSMRVQPGEKPAETTETRRTA